MTRQMAGAYVAPILDVLEMLANTNEAQGQMLMDHVFARAMEKRHAGEMIAQAEAMQAWPDFMLQGLKKSIGGEHGA